MCVACVPVRTLAQPAERRSNVRNHCYLFSIQCDAREWRASRVCTAALDGMASDSASPLSHLTDVLLLRLLAVLRFYAEIASFTANTIEAKKKSSTKIIDNNLLVCVRCTLGYAGCGGYANVEAYSTQQRIKSILFYSTNDDNDKATEWVENGGEQ